MKTGTRTPLPDFKRKTKGFWKTGELLECTKITAENTNVNSYFFKDLNIFSFPNGLPWRENIKFWKQLLKNLWQEN